MIRGKRWTMAVPTGLAPSGVSASCNATANATGYRWFRQRGFETAFDFLADTTLPTIPNCGLGGVGGTVNMKVAALHRRWISGRSDFVTVNLEGGTVPDQPTGLFVSTGGFCSWNLTPNTDRWMVERKPAAGVEADYESAGMAMNSGDPTFQDPDVGTLADGQYDYRVIAQNIAGDSVPSDPYRVTYSSATLGSGTWATPFDRGYDYGQDANVTTTATGTGNWTDASKWDNGVPTSSSVARIPSGITITMDATNGQAKTVSLLGNLFHPTGANSKLTVDQIFNYSSGYHRIGTTSSPVGAAFTAEIVFRDTAINTTVDPRQHGTGYVCLGGKLEACGSDKTHRLRCTVDPLTGQTSITVGSTPTAWANGDKLILHQTAQIADQTSTAWQTDMPLVSGTPSSGTINLQSALNYDHRGAKHSRTGTVEYRCWVGNMTRNVKFYSANPSGTRGHMYFTGTADVNLQRCEFTGLGRTENHPFNNSTFDPTTGATISVGTNQQGRYMIHFHRIYGRLGVTPQAIIKDCVIAEFVKTAYPNGHNPTANTPPRWACNFHGITDAVFERNIIFNCCGSGLFNGEDGSECRNTIKDNLIIRVLGTGSRPDERGGELGYEGGHIWCRNPNNYITGNVCAEGSVHHNQRPAMGITYYPRLLTNAMVPNSAGSSQTDMSQMTMTDVTNVPIPAGGNEDNEFWGCGFYPWSVGSYGVSPHLGIAWSEVNNLRVLHFAGHGIYNYEVHRMKFTNYVCRMDDNGVFSRGEVGEGYFTGDYVAGDTWFVTPSITGCKSGFDLPNIGSYGGAKFIIENPDLDNYYNIYNTRIYYNANITNSKPLRKYLICTTGTVSILRNGTIDLGSVSGPPSHWVNPPYNFSRGTNDSAEVDVSYVYDWQNNTGDDFIVYFDTAERGDSFAQRLQDAGTTGAVRNTGPPEAGHTNLTSWQQHRACDGGRLPPASPTTKTGFTGVVTGPILPDWVPADLTGYWGGFEVATHRLFQGAELPIYGPPYGGVDNDSAVPWMEDAWLPFGNSGYWYQSTAGSRPTYRENPPRLETDGGDWMQRIAAMVLTGTFRIYGISTSAASSLHAILGNTTDASGVEITASNTVKVYTAGSSVESAAITRTTGRHFWTIWRDGSNVIKYRSDESGEVTVGTLAGTITINTVLARQFASAFCASGQSVELIQVSNANVGHASADDLSARGYNTSSDAGFTIADLV